MSQDDYGFGAAMKTALQTFEMHSRRSGRTSRMLDSLKPNTTIVALNDAQARHLRDELKRRNRTDCKVIVGQGTPEKARGMTNVTFDHNWVRDMYEVAIARTSKDIQYIWETLNPPDVGEKVEREWEFREEDRA